MRKRTFITIGLLLLSVTAFCQPGKCGAVKQPAGGSNSYYQFKKLLDSGKVWAYAYDEPMTGEKAKASAYEIYQRTPDNKDTKVLRTRMERELATAMVAALNKAIEVYTRGNRSAALGLPVVTLPCPSYKEPMEKMLGRDAMLEMGVLHKVYFMKAISYPRSSKALPREREQWLDSALAIDANCSYALQCKMLHSEAIKDPANEIKYARHALQADPALFFCYDHIAKAYRSIGKLDSSTHYFRQLNVALDAARKEIHAYFTASTGYTHAEATAMIATIYRYPVFETGLNYFLLGNSDSAIQYLTAYNNNVPYTSDRELTGKVFFSAGEYYVTIQQYNTAAQYYIQAAELKKEARINLQVAQSYALAGDEKEAAKYLGAYLDAGMKMNYGATYQALINDKALGLLKNSKEVNGVLKKYFPKEYN